MNDGLHTYKFQLFGRVQGVGMRFSIKHQARKIGLSGAVKNCLDGSVEGTIQGTKPQIETFFAWLKEKAPGRIDRVLQEKMPSSPSFQTFTIEH
jgi:acylphosphatase